MKTRNNFSPIDLKADALDYIFTEWLVRNRLYHKFLKNLQESLPAIVSPRDYLRTRILSHVSNRIADYSILIDGAFIFAGTPEGLDFWKNASNRWREFLDSYINF